MRRTLSASALAALVPAVLAALPPPAAADPSGSPDGQGGPGVTRPADGPARAPFTVGARVGGYGFRNPGTVDDHGHVAWDACRMNGLGVFARRPVGRLFAEAGADLYFAESFPMTPAPGDEAIDRVSGLLTVAIGADVVRTRRVSIHAQLGAGLELTRVAMTMATGEVHKDRRALPVGFVGVGETVKEQLESDVAFEYSAIGQLQGWIARARELGDNGTEDLLTRILVSEEEHTDWLETQLELIKQLGEPGYLAQQLHG